MDPHRSQPERTPPSENSQVYLYFGALTLFLYIATPAGALVDIATSFMLKNQLHLTAVVVTHDLDLMYKVADRVVVLYEGSVIYFGPTAGLEKSDHPHIREFLEMDRVV